MPFTFLAHQGPFLALARRWARLVDPITFMVGTMSPDFAYVLSGTPANLDAHRLPSLVTFCVPASLAVAWLIVAVLAPVVPDHLPQGGGFRLHDYRALATHCFRLGPALLGAVAGALSHVALDSFTHEWGWVPNHVEWYRTAFGGWTWLGRPWTPFRVMQYLGHVGGSAWCVALLWVYGRRAWLAERAATQPPAHCSGRTHLALWIAAVAGTAVGTLWATTGEGGPATAILRLAGGAFVGLCVGARVAGWVPAPKTG